MEYGSIIVNVRTANGSFGVENAGVTIFGVAEDNTSPVAVKFSDVSGNTEAVRVPAPPKAQSLTPGAGEKPYSSYVIETVKAGYYTVTNLMVPVFSGVTSIQNVDLVPLAEGSIVYPQYNVRYLESAAPDL